ncbi:hypothetical protein STCU_08445 [Strigomonas culicis]|uniref:Uncharacterized protein n=1 Tax=Strigomonas culicis TaxID=28005 RepID=S9V4Q3_9TRYP|nr:hypothetical protein STCU_08445 [Strigomonas culicis]|eukprot:EPY21891.1 hypothetical protein STCU_08445 [Strigomonas culicis]
MDGATLLPPTCGKETGLPGVPGVGCVVTLKYSGHLLSGERRAFSACLIASDTDVHVLGPNLEAFPTTRRLTSRRLWRIPSSHAAPTRPRHVPERSQNPLVSSDDELSDSGTFPAPANAVASRNICLQAFLLYGRGQMPPRELDDDTTAVLIAWSDEHGAHHVSLLLFSLVSALNPSISSLKLRVTFVRDIIQIEPQEYVLRLFYDSALSSTGDDAAAEDGGAHPVPRWVVLCATYRMTARRAPGSRSKVTPLGGGLSTAAGGGAGGGEAGGKTRPRTDPAPTAMGSAVLLSGGPGPLSGQAYGHAASAGDRAQTRELYMEGSKRFISLCGGGAAYGGTTAFYYDKDEGALAFVLPRSGAAPATADGYVLCAGDARAEEVQPWCWGIPEGHAISAFAVQRRWGAAAESSEGSTRALAVVGTTDGRVYVLRHRTCTLAKRLTGPIADLCFVNTRHVRGPAEVRPRVVEAMLRGRDGNRREGAAAADMEDSPSASAALVVLDSVGRVVVLRAINSDAPVSQLVNDVKQVVAFEERHETPLVFSRCTSPIPPVAEPKGARQYLDITTLGSCLRHGDPAARAEEPAAGAAAAPATAPPKGGSLASKPLKPAEMDRRTNGYAGHILSRGVLCAACLDGATEGNEVLVSTMGQAVVSIPFDTKEFTFAIAGFMVTPTPMFFIGFADFFGSGCEDLVMASLQSIIVARRRAEPVKEKAKLLLRQLNKRRGHLPSGALGAPRMSSVIET